MAGKNTYYKARAIADKAAFGTSKNKGTRYIAVPFQVEGTGQTFPWDGYFTENTSERTVESLRIAGCTFPGNKLTDLTGLGSKVVDIAVEETEFGPRVAWVNEPKVTSVTDENRLDGAALDSFAKEMSGLLKATAGQTARRPAAKAARPASDPWEQAPSNGGAPPAEWDGTGVNPNGADDDRAPPF